MRLAGLLVMIKARIRPYFPKSTAATTGKTEASKNWQIDSERGGYNFEDFFVAYDEIEEIIAQKVDHWSYDDIEIIVGFRSPDVPDPMWVTISESHPQFKAVMVDLEVHFTLQRGWWRKVAFPAFQANRTTIWRRGQ